MADRKEKSEKLDIAGPREVVPRANVAERDRRLVNPGLSVLSQYQGLPPDGPPDSGRRDVNLEPTRPHPANEQTSALNIMYAQMLEERSLSPLSPARSGTKPASGGTFAHRRGQGAEDLKRRLRSRAGHTEGEISTPDREDVPYGT